jgi:hypothetical protein
VALWDTSPEQPGGEVFVAGDDITEVVRTPEVQRRIAKGFLVQVDAPAAKAVDDSGAASTAGTSGEPGGGETTNPEAGTGGSTDDPPATFEEQLRAALPDNTAEVVLAAGFDSAEKIQAATDDELVKLQGVGPASVTKLRETFPKPAEEE